MKGYYKLTEDILNKVPQSRDDDQILYAHILAELNFNIFKQPATNLIKQVSDKKLPSLDSITRIRRMIQRQNAFLRGALYDKRHGIKQEKAKSDLGYPNLLQRNLQYA